MAGAREKKIASDLEKVIAEFLNKEVAPLFDAVIISVVRTQVSPDLKDANIYVSIYNLSGKTNTEKIFFTVRDKAGLARSEVAKKCKTYHAEVPGCFELDLMQNGIEKDPVFGNNSWEYQKYENAHVWYYTEFTVDTLPERPALCFDGLDTIAEIYVNGEKAARSENMMLPCRITDCGLKTGKNTVVVHFIPACIEARKYRLPASSNTLFYNYQSH